MTMQPISLSIENKFKVVQFDLVAKRLTREQAIEILAELKKQCLLKESAIARLEERKDLTELAAHQEFAIKTFLIGLEHKELSGLQKLATAMYRESLLIDSLNAQRLRDAWGISQC